MSNPAGSLLEQVQGDNGVVRQRDHRRAYGPGFVLWVANKGKSRAASLESHWIEDRAALGRTASECLVTVPETTVVRLESQISIKKEDLPSPQEIERHDNSTAAKGLESATDGIESGPRRARDVWRQ